MLEYLKNKNIMIVAAHPDDELLGLGSSMNLLINKFNVKTKVVILGEGITSRSDKRNTNKWKEELEKHKKNIFNASKKIGYKEVKTYSLPDNRFDSVDLLSIIKLIENEKKLFKPDVIFTHHSGDLNIDHRITFNAVITSCRPLEGENVKTILTFETPSSTEWISSSEPKNFFPNVFISFDSDNLQAKIDAMECYQYEKRKYPHPRSPESLKILAKRNGVIIGKEYAEAFMLIRNIN